MGEYEIIKPHSFENAKKHIKSKSEEFTSTFSHEYEFITCNNIVVPSPKSTEMTVPKKAKPYAAQYLQLTILDAPVNQSLSYLCTLFLTFFQT